MWKPQRIDFLAVAIAISGVVFWYDYDKSVKQEAPATDWFSVKNISVPDFIEGDDPLIVYDRDIKKPFSGTWSVEAHGATASTNYAVCTGSGTNKYQPGETLPEGGVKLSWFIGKQCELPAGSYNLEVNYEIRPSGYPSKLYTATSNIFNIAPKGSQLFIDPSQVDQLDKAEELFNNPKVIEQMQVPQ